MVAVVVVADIAVAVAFVAHAVAGIAFDTESFDTVDTEGGMRMAFAVLSYIDHVVVVEFLVATEFAVGSVHQSSLWVRWNSSGLIMIMNLPWTQSTIATQTNQFLNQLTISTASDYETIGP